MSARGEGPNEIGGNGEAWLQAQLLRIMAHETRTAAVFDVGANVGDWSLALLDAARAAALPVERLALHAFEPVPGTRAMFEARLAGAHPGAGVTVSAVALSHQRQTRIMHVLHDGAGTNSLEGAPDGENGLRVETDTVDGYCQDHVIPDILLLKCDTEGHDLFVIEGAVGMLNRGAIGVLQFEYNFRWHFPGRNLKQVFDLVERLEMPYLVGRLRPSRIELFESWHPELDRFFEANFVLVRSDLESVLPCHRGRFDAANTYA
jgi:FkbM family methyltransferase